MAAFAYQELIQTYYTIARMDPIISAYQRMLSADSQALLLFRQDGTIHHRSENFGACLRAVYGEFAELPNEIATWLKKPPPWWYQTIDNGHKLHAFYDRHGEFNLLRLYVAPEQYDFDPLEPELGERTVQVLTLLDQGLEVADIAARLGVSGEGVKHHTRKLLRFFYASKTADAVRLAREACEVLRRSTGSG